MNNSFIQQNSNKKQKTFFTTIELKMNIIYKKLSTKTSEFDNDLRPEVSWLGFARSERQDKTD